MPSVSDGVKTGLAVVLVVVSVTGIAVATGAVEPPDVTAVDNDFAGVSERTTEIDTDVALYNPIPFGTTVRNLTVSYRVQANGVPLARGVHRGFTLTRGPTRLDFTTRVANERISRWWIRHVNRGERSRVTATVGVNPPVLDRTLRMQPVSRTVRTNVIGAFRSSKNRAVSGPGLGVTGPLVVVRETHATWGEATRRRTPVRMEFVVHNPHPYPVTISEIGYDVAMNGVGVGHGTTEPATVIPPQGTRTLDARLVIRTERIDEWWVTHLERGQVTTVRVDYYLRIDPGVLVGPVRVPLETMRTTIRTDFFGESTAVEAQTAVQAA